MIRAAALAALLPLAAIAGPVLEVTSDDHSIIALYGEAGPCVGGALKAEYTAKDGVTKIPGCFQMRGDHVVIVFFDTDTAAIPIAAFRPPKRT